jgi:hypothetical protein
MKTTAGDNARAYCAVLDTGGLKVSHQVRVLDAHGTEEEGFCFRRRLLYTVPGCNGSTRLSGRVFRLALGSWHDAAVDFVLSDDRFNHLVPGQILLELAVGNGAQGHRSKQFLPEPHD